MHFSHLSPTSVICAALIAATPAHASALNSSRLYVASKGVMLGTIIGDFDLSDDAQATLAQLWGRSCNRERTVSR